MMLDGSGRDWEQGTRFYGLLFTPLGNFNELEACQAAGLFWLSTVQGSEDGSMEVGNVVGCGAGHRKDFAIPFLGL